MVACSMFVNIVNNACYQTFFLTNMSKHDTLATWSFDIVRSMHAAIRLIVVFFNTHVATLLSLSSSTVLLCWQSCLFGEQFIFHVFNLQHQILLHSKTRPTFNKHNDHLPHVVDCCVVVVANETSLSLCCFSVFFWKENNSGVKCSWLSMHC